MDSERQNIVNELCGQDTVKSLTTIGGDDNVRTEGNENKKLKLSSSKLNATTRITDLNDYCLLEIFSLQWLNLLDFCALAETCQKFKRIVQRAVPQELVFAGAGGGKKLKIETKNYPSHSFNRNEAYKILEAFGSLLTTVTINSICDVECNLLIGRLCHAVSVDKLKHFTLRNHGIYRHGVLELKSIFNTLQTLKLESVHIVDDATSLFADMNELVELTLRYVSDVSAVMENTFPKLRQFKCRCHDRYLGILADFILRHNTITALHIDFRDVTRKTENIVEAIGHSCKTLEELAIFYGEATAADHLTPLWESLSCLKTLELGHVVIENFDFLSTLTKLEDLRLRSCELPTCVSQFTELKRLKRFEITPE